MTCQVSQPSCVPRAPQQPSEPTTPLTPGASTWRGAGHRRRLHHLLHTLHAGALQLHRGDLDPACSSTSVRWRVWSSIVLQLGTQRAHAVRHALCAWHACLPVLRAPLPSSGPSASFGRHQPTAHVDVPACNPTPPPAPPTQVHGVINTPVGAIVAPRQPLHLIPVPPQDPPADRQECCVCGGGGD